MWRHQKSRSVCVKQALNTRRWLVNALVAWHISYKITTVRWICANVWKWPNCPTLFKSLNAVPSILLDTYVKINISSTQLSNFKMYQTLLFLPYLQLHVLYIYNMHKKQQIILHIPLTSQKTLRKKLHPSSFYCFLANFGGKECNFFLLK